MYVICPNCYSLLPLSAQLLWVCPNCGELLDPLAIGDWYAEILFRKEVTKSWLRTGPSTL